MSNLITAVDIGAQQLKVVTLRRRKQHWGVVAAVSENIADYDHNRPEYASQIAGVLRRLVKEQSVPVGGVIVGVSGRGGMLRYLTMPVMPPWRLELAMKYEVDEQLSNLNQVAENIASDYSILEIPDFDPDQFPVLLALSQKEAVHTRLQICETALKKTPVDADLNVFGAFNAFRQSPQCLDDEVSVLLDVGADEIQLTIQKGAQLLFARTIPGGGARQTMAIASAFQVLPTRAEEIKLDRGAVFAPDDPEMHDDDAARVSQCLQKEIAGMVQAIQSAMVFFLREFKLEGLRPEKLYYTGCGALLPGLMTELGRRVRMPAEPLILGNIFAFFADPQQEALLSTPAGSGFATAVGLALSRAAAGGLKLSMLPQGVKERRKFWSEKIFVYYAAAAAAAAAILLIVNSWKIADAARNRNQHWGQQLETAKHDHAEFLKLEERNARAATMLRDLLARVGAGNAIAGCLDNLRAKTPPEIFYVDLTFTPAAGGGALPAGPAAGNKAPAVNNNRMNEKEDNAALRIGGYLVGQKDYQTACLRLEKYINDLKTMSEFAAVSPQVMELVQDKVEIKPVKKGKDEADETVGQPLFNERQRFNSMYVPQLTGDSDNAPREVAPEKGSALYFVIVCKLKP